MEDNNFVQKFDVNQKSNSKQIFSAILISFISAIIGGACALGIYLGIANNPKEETVDTSTSNINNNSYQIIVPLSSDAFTCIHKNDLSDYIKYFNNASYKNTTAAYYNNYKLNVDKLDLDNIKIDKNNYRLGIKLYIYKNHEYQILTIPNNVNKKTMN